MAYKESKQDADYAPNMETLTDAGFDLIWGIGFLMGDAIKSTAQINPDQKYAIIDFAYGPETPKNVAGIVFQEEQPSFLVGYIAGKMTKTNKVGFVGGIKFPLIERFEYGYMAGVKMANPKCEVLAQYAESFTDAAKGKAIANNIMVAFFMRCLIYLCSSDRCLPFHQFQVIWISRKSFSYPTTHSCS